MTTLENSYCVPRTVEEWKSLTSYPFWCGYKRGEFIDGFSCVEAFKPITFKKSYVLQQSDVTGSETEISVSHFLDLLHDRITPWRLEEVGFKVWPNSQIPASMRWENESQYTIEVIDDFVYVNSASFNITTFTDLLTLIRMLTPPTQKT